MDSIIGTNEIIYLVNLFFCLLSGVLIGSERELRHKPAGISTQTLVIGAAMTFSFISHSFGLGDPSRIAAQIVTGVGFLGAGVIIRTESDKVSNLTTAASIWYAAAIGMALGFNYHFIAIVATIYAVFVSRLPQLRVKPSSKETKSE